MTSKNFWDKVNKNTLDGCWEWTAAKTPAGYGVFTLYAHRESLRMSGVEIPDGKFVLHRCDNPSCVNPAHLFVGTCQDNHDDMRRKGRAPTRNGNAKLTEHLVRELRAWKAAGWSLRKVAPAFGLSTGHASQIINRKIWRSVA